MLWLYVLSGLLAVAYSQMPGGEPGRPGPGPIGIVPPTEATVNYTFPSTYLATCTKVIRPGQTFSISFTFPDTGNTADIELVTELRSIPTQKDETSQVLVLKENTISRARCNAECPTSAVVTFTTPNDLPDENYNVSFYGTSGEMMKFANSTQVKTMRNTYSIMIQTDKGKYKPSQTVKFRVIAVSPNLKPIDVPMNITLHDPNDNRIKQFINRQTTDKGVLSFQFALSDQPTLGHWKIKAVGPSAAEEVMFEVDEYVLPKYEVGLDMPLILFNMDKVVITVTAKYTYGQPVKGKASLYVQKQMYPYQLRNGVKVLSSNSTKKLVDGKADFEFTKKEIEALLPSSRYYEDDLKLERSIGQQLVFSASVLEELTGKVLVKNDTVSISAHKYSLEILPATPENFRPGMTLSLYVMLKSIHGTPLSPSDLINPKTGSNYDIKIYDSYTNYRRAGDETPRPLMGVTKVGDDGVALFNVNVVKGLERMGVLFEVDGLTNGREYGDTVQVTKYLNLFKTRDEGGIQISLGGTKDTITAGENTAFMVKTVMESSVINLLLQAKGVVVMSETREFTPGLEHTFTLTIDDALAQKLSPKARAIVWYVTNTMEVIAESYDFNVAGAFANDVSIKFSKDTAKPNDDVDVLVKASPDSYVGILAVDTSTLLMSAGNPITQDLVIEKLNEYDSTNDHNGFYPQPFFGDMMVRGKRSIWWGRPYSTGGKNTYQIFENAGTLVMTDMYMFVEPPPQRYQYMERGPVRADAGLRGAVGAAGPRQAMAESARGAAPPAKSSVSGSNQEPTRTRTDFPETWIWIDEKIGANGEVTIQTKAPDTITSWVASAFAINSADGLGVSDQDAEITVFKPFFVSLDLPYSVIRGEEMELKIVIFNYRPESLDVSLKMMKSMMFGVKEPNGIEYNHATVETTLTVPPNDGKTVKIWIKPLALGQVPVEVRATSSAAGDAVRRNMLVEAEGAPEDYQINVLVETSNNKDFSVRNSMSLPTEGLVPGSERIDVIVMGDIMGQTMNNLESLVKMPYGCGEQNMLNFAPNIFVMNYLKATGKEDPALTEKATTFMEKGYQRELTYQRNDGSFSAFGNSDSSGSTWLTAFVVKSFYAARDLIDIDLYNVARAAGWMLEQQVSNGRDEGRFLEPGRVIHNDMQGGSSGEVTLTAYVAITLIEIKSMTELDGDRIMNALQKSLDYIEKQIPRVKNDPYTMSVISYLMSIAKDASADKIYKDMMMLANSEDGLIYWDKKTTVQTTPDPRADVIIWRPPKRPARTSAIESTGYAMLAHMAMNRIDKDKYTVGDAVPIMKWLVAQRNSFGGYGSTQDTIVALASLTDFGSVASGGAAEMTINVRTSVESLDFNISPRNSLVLQKQQLTMSGIEDIVDITASGKGMALAQISVSYNILRTADSQDIDLEVTSGMRDDGSIDVKICALYLPKEASGMVMLTTKMLSGYMASNLEELKETIKSLKRIDAGDKVYSFYFDELVSGEQMCMVVKQTQIHKVKNIQKAAVSVALYYKPDIAKTNFYLPYALAQEADCNTCPSCCENPNIDQLFEFKDMQVPGKEIQYLFRGHSIPDPVAVIDGSSVVVSMTTLIMVALTVSLLHKFIF